MMFVNWKGPSLCKVEDKVEGRNNFIFINISSHTRAFLYHILYVVLKFNLTTKKGAARIKYLITRSYKLCC